MSYELAMEKAGAKVLVFEYFGSWQGDWWAKVEYKGVQSWTHGTYGSCSGCDAFEGEFGSLHTECLTHRYHPTSQSCEECRQCKEEYDNRLAEFGKEYLANVYSQREAETKASKYNWDLDADRMVNFIKENAIYEKVKK